MTIQSKILCIARAVVQTPSGTNCQPWKVKIKGTTLNVFHESKRAEVATLPDDLSVFGLGMIAAVLQLTSKQQHLSMKMETHLKNRNDQTPWLTADFSPENYSQLSSIDELLVSTIFERHTDRRDYNGGTLQDPVFKEALDENASVKGANLYLIDDYSDDYIKAFNEADILFLKWPELRRDFMKWARFTKTEMEKKEDGDYWTDLLGEKRNLKYFVRLFIWTMMRDYRIEWFNQIFLKIFNKSYQLTPVTYKDGAGLGCITTKTDSVEDLFESGLLSMRLWLLFNARGYGFQHLCNLTMFVYPEKCGRFQLPDHLNQYLHGAYSCMQTNYGFPDGEIPVFSFRTGIAIGPFPKEQRTLRRKDRICII